MESDPKPVIPYATPAKATGSKTAIIVILALTGALALFLLGMLSFRTTVVVNAPATVTATGINTPAPVVVSPAVTLRTDSIDVAYGNYILARDGDAMLAFRMLPQSVDGRPTIKYEWAYSPNGRSGFSSPDALRGEGVAAVKDGIAVMRAGKFTLRWSRNPADVLPLHWPAEMPDIQFSSHRLLSLEDASKPAPDEIWRGRP
jgi:hypothetical protein